MKKLVKNYIYSSLYQILLLIIPIITIPYVARALGAEAIGINSYVVSVSTVFIYIGMLGLDKYASREVAYYRENRSKLNCIFSELLTLRLSLLLIVLIGYIIFSLFSEYRLLMLIQGVYIVGYLIDIAWLYNGLEDFKTTAIRSIIIKLVNVACIFIFVKSPDDLWKYIFINAILMFLGNLVLYYRIGRRVSYRFPPWRKTAKHIPMTLKLFVPQMAIQLYLQLGKIMTESITNDSVQVAYYDQADKIVKLPVAFITALSSVMLPRVSNEFKKNNHDNVKVYINKSLRFALFLGIPIMAGIIGIAPTLIPWLLGSEFLPVVRATQVLAPIIIAICITNVVGDQYLTAINNTKALTFSYVSGAIVNFLFNLIFINQFGYFGAIVSMLITELVIVFIQVLTVKKIFYIKKNLSAIIKYTVATTAMLTVLLLLNNLPVKPVLITVAQLVAGPLVYFAILLIIFHDETITLVVRRLRQMLSLKKKGGF